MLFSTTAATLWIPITSRQKFQSLHVFACAYFLFIDSNHWGFANWYLIEVLISIAQIIRDAKTYYMCFLATYISSLEKWLLKSFLLFFFFFTLCCSFVCTIDLGVLYLFLILSFYAFMIGKYFLPFYGLPFHKTSNFNIVYFFSCCLCFSYHIQQSFAK